MPYETDKTAGDDIDSRCLKCKSVTNHTIIAMTGDVIAKVQCNSCGARHNFRPPVEEKKKGSSTVRRRGGTVTVSSSTTPKAKAKASPSKKVSRGAANFDALIQGKNVEAAIPYTIEATLKAGDVVDHKVFGLGVVTAIMPPNKAQLTFREHGSKLLVCKSG